MHVDHTQVTQLTQHGQLTQIGQIAVPVRDIEASVKFYRDILGMQFLFQASPGLGFFDLNGVRLMLDSPAQANAGNSSVIYYKVADIVASYTSFLERGVHFIGAPHLVAKLPDHDIWMAFLHDPDMNILALMAEVRN
jgi:methylmalonyl-CoA/ethylmalonyl-CoA epimerase